MNKKLRFFIVLITLGVGLYFSYPTMKWYFLFNDEQKSQVNRTVDGMRSDNLTKTEQDIAELMDLVQADNNAVLPDRFSYLKAGVKKGLKEAGFEASSPLKIVDVAKVYSRTVLQQTIENEYARTSLEQQRIFDRIIRLGLDIFGGISVVLQGDPESLQDKLGREPTPEEVEIAMNGVSNALVNRIDSFGVTEPQVRRLGDDQILLEIPGESNAERVETYVLGRGRLTFNLEDRASSASVINRYIEKTGDVTGRGLDIGDDGRPTDPELDALLRAGLVMRGYYTKDSYGIDQLVRYIAVESEPILDGNYIREARANYDTINAGWNTTFRLDTEGGDIFYNFTKDNVNEGLSVIIDNKIRSSANISEALRSNVSISGLSQQESSDLALLLQTAALPIDLTIENQQTVGPALGEETIQTGLKAILIGLIAVIIFMLVWYKESGVFASIALLINFFLILSLLSVMNFTLTLTSIASLILTVGMAVDANVIIFERIKEELREGKARIIAVDIGFKRAFSTIIDANITTFIAAVFLSVLGQGSIQGFAVVLTVGIVCTIFTALFVVRLMFDVGTDTFHKKQVSISWTK